MSSADQVELLAELKRVREHIDTKLDTVANAMVALRQAVHDEVDTAFLQVRQQGKADLEAASKLILGAVDGASAELGDVVRRTAAGLDRKLDSVATRIEGKTDALASVVAAHREVSVEHARKLDRILHVTDVASENGNGGGNGNGNGDDFEDERPTLTE